MKSIHLKISFVLLILCFLGAGCEKEEEYEDIALENNKCPCEREVAFIKKISKENILLFDTEKTSLDEMKTQTFDGEKSEFVSYSKESKSMSSYTVRSTMTGISYVCNVPDKINDWIIPSTGIMISFDADEFEMCIYPGSIANDTYSNCVLTSLRRTFK